MAKGDFKKKYDELLSTHDYRGLADLLRSSNYDSYEARNRAYSMADRFEEEADIRDKLLEDATQEQKNAYNFIANGPQKSLDPNVPTDEYSIKFSECWNKLAGEDGTIRLHFRNSYPKYGISYKASLDDFVEGSGISRDKFNEFGITRSNTDGDEVLIINTDNPYKMEIYKGVYNAIVNAYKQPVRDPKLYDPKEAYTSYARSDNGLTDEEKRKMFLTPSSIIFDDDISSKYTVENLTTQNFGKTNTNTTYFDDLIDLVTEANNSYYELMSKTKPYILQTVVTGYMGEDDKQLQQAFSAGAMDLQTFKEARSLLEEKYNRILQTKDLSQYNVYAMNEDNNGSHLLQKLEDNILKAQLDEEINLAMAENRLHFSHASNGLMYGTMITIDQRQDTKKNPMEEYPARRFFVQDLFRSEAENSLRQDTQSDAMLQYSKHQTYGHVYRAKDGGRIENWDGILDAAQYTDEYGNSRIIYKGEILDIMDNDIITRRLIDYYKRATLRSNINGNLYTEEGYQVFGGNKFDNDILITHIKQKSIQAMAAKYGDPNSDYVKVKANRLASTIIQKLGLDLTDDKSL